MHAVRGSTFLKSTHWEVRVRGYRSRSREISAHMSRIQQHQQPRRHLPDSGTRDHLVSTRDHLVRNTEIDETGGLSQYEIERRLTMERNHRKLQELGLVTHKTPARVTPARKPLNRDLPWQAPCEKQAQTLRRSLRTRGKTAPIYTENAVDFDDESNDGGSRKRSRPMSRQSVRKEDQRGASLPSVIIERQGKARHCPAPGSSRNLECDVARLTREHLGRRFTVSGKATVMDLATRSRQPKFSRMSGLTEWKNAVFLWVNVGKGGGYTNIFEGNSIHAGRGNDQGSTCEKPCAPDSKNGATPVGEVNDGQGNGGRDNSVNSYPPGIPSESRRETSSSNVSVAGGLDAQGGMHDDRHSILRMTWYASARMTPESTLIQRLLKSKRVSGMRAGGVSFDAPATMPEDSNASTNTGWARTDSSQTQAQTKNPKDDSDATEYVAPAIERVPEALAELIITDDRAADSREAQKAFPNDASNGRDGDDDVLLFCRLANEPYVFCGRLQCEKYWPSERPMRFTWRLMDAERLARYPDFAAIVDAAAVPGAQDELR